MPSIGSQSRQEYKFNNARWVGKTNSVKEVLHVVLKIFHILREPVENLREEPLGIRVFIRLSVAIKVKIKTLSKFAEHNVERVDAESNRIQKTNKNRLFYVLSVYLLIM